MTASIKDINEILAIVERAGFAEFHLSFEDLEVHVVNGQSVGDSSVQSGGALPSSAPIQFEAPHDVMPASTTALPQAVGGPEKGPTGNQVAIRAPMVGTFYRAPSPGETPFVSPGQNVSAGEVLCLFEVMKLFNTITANSAGRIAAILVEDGASVDRDQIPDADRARAMKPMPAIGIIDTTLRDAPQCLWATRMTTPHMLPIAQTLDACGFDQIDLAGLIQFDVCVRYLKENPWERVRLMRERVVNTPLRTIVRSKSLIGFDILPDDVVELWVERVVANGFRVVGAFDGLNDVDNMLTSLRAAKRLGVRTFGTLSYSLSPVHTDELYVRTAKKLVEQGQVDGIMLKDAAGLLTVDRIRTLVPALKAVVGSVPVELHSHCLTGLAPLVYLEGVKAGADLIHTSVGPLADGPAQPATQAMMRDLRLLGFDTRADEARIAEVSDYFRDLALREGKPLGATLPYSAFHYEHQLPGGMLSNFKAQLDQVGLLHKFDELLQECARVRHELGYPIMITPFAQFVGTQAVLNIVQGERYRTVPDEVKKYVLGYYGKLPAPVDSDILDRIVGNGSPSIALTPAVPAPAVAALRKKYPSATDEERLLRLMFAGNQVDEMKRAGPIEARLSVGRPLAQLLNEIGGERRSGRVRIRKGTLEVELTYGG